MKGMADTITDLCWQQTFDVENVDIRSISITLMAYRDDYHLGYITRSYQDSDFTSENSYRIDDGKHTRGSYLCNDDSFLLSFQFGIYK